MRRLLVPATIVVSLIWVVLLCAAPVLPAPISALTYLAGSFICHQRPERSFYLGVTQLPVCARCLGIYAGAALVGPAWALLGSELRRAGATRRFARSALVLGALPTVITVAAEWSGVWQPSNTIRAIAGVPAGLAVVLVVVGAMTTLHYGECAPRRPIGPPRPPTPT